MKTNARKNNHDYGQLLMVAAVLVSMPRWAGAFIAADVSTVPEVVNQALHYLNLVSGFGMALLEVVGAAYLLDAWGKMKPKRTHNAKSYDHRWIILSGFVLGLFLLMPLILAPYIVSRMTSTPIANLGDEWFPAVWSVAVVMSPVFIIGGVAVARDGLVGVETASPQPTQTEAKVKPPATYQRQESGNLPVNLPADWRQLTDRQRYDLAHTTRDKREDMFPELADRTRRLWHERLDEIATQNGGYLQEVR